MTTNAPIIISLEQLMADAPNTLIGLKDGHHTDDIIIEWRVDVEVTQRGDERYHVFVVLAGASLSADEAEALCTPLTADTERQIFAFIPISDFGTKAFGIFIADNNFGDVLTESLVQEVIEKAGIEEALSHWAAT